MQRGRRFTAGGRSRPYFVLADVIVIPSFAAALAFVYAAAFILGDVIVDFSVRGVLWQTRGRVWPIICLRLE